MKAVSEDGPYMGLRPAALVIAIWSIDRKSAGKSAYAMWDVPTQAQRVAPLQRGHDVSCPYANRPMSRRVGRDLLGGLLRLEVKEQDAVADACGVVGLGNLERHEAAIGGDDWIGSFPACIVVEIRKASEVLSGSVEF